MNLNDFDYIKPFKESIIIASIYLVMSVTWVIFSDYLLFYFFGEDLLAIKNFQFIKSVLFVLATGITIFFLMLYSLNKIRKLDMTLEKKENIINLKSIALNEIRRDLEKQQSLTDKVVRSSSLVVLALDQDYRITKANDYFYEYTNYDKGDIIHKKIFEFIKQDKNVSLISIMDDIKQENIISNLEVIVNCKDDIEKYMLMSISSTVDKGGNVTEYIVIGIDISENKYLQNTIDKLNSYDSLTGLPKPHYLEKQFKTLLSKSVNRDYAFLYINIDNFSQVNEFSGYRAGNYLLMKVGELIKNLGDKHLVSRIHGDNFLIILDNVKSNEEIVAKVQRIQEYIRIPWEFENERFFISSTIGIALMEKDGKDFDALLKNASIAMEYCKKNNRAGYHFYQDSIQKEVVDSVSMLNEIRKALINKEFSLDYQMVYDLDNDGIYGVESLIRWNHPTKGLIHPIDFIPLAETTNLIFDIHEIVVDMALRQKRTWNDKNINISKIAINLSSKSFDNENLVEFIESKLKEYNIKPTELVLEITESGFVQSLENIDRNVRNLRRLGIEIALDDFGTGYSSLSRLRDLQIDYLKLDKSFIMNLDKDEEIKAMITSVIYLAQALNLKVVAEGVETKEQLKVLKELGCNLAQGYFIQKPIHAELFKDLVDKFYLGEVC